MIADLAIPRFRRLSATLLVLAMSCATPAALAQEQVPADLPGNCNSDARLDISDAIFTLSYLYLDGERPLCLARCDFEGDGSVNVTDPIAILAYLYEGSGELRLFEPPPEECADGEDNDCDGEVDEGCEAFMDLSVDLVWDEVTVDENNRPEIIASYRVYRLSVDPPSALRLLEVGPECACATVDLRLPVGGSAVLVVRAVDLAGNESKDSNHLTVP